MDKFTATCGSVEAEDIEAAAGMLSRDDEWQGARTRELDGDAVLSVSARRWLAFGIVMVLLGLYLVESGPGGLIGAFESGGDGVEDVKHAQHVPNPDVALNHATLEPELASASTYTFRGDTGVVLTNASPRLATQSEPTCQWQQRSLRYSEACGLTGSEPPFKVLVGGIGRSGTKFFTTLLNELGYHFSHDRRGGPPTDGSDGAVSWMQDFSPEPFKMKDGSERSCTPINRWELTRRFKHVFHFVREPLRNINSRFNQGKPGGAIFLQTDCETTFVRDLPRKLSSFDRRLAETLRHWVFHNKFVEGTADWGLRVEQLDRDRIFTIQEFARRAELDFVPTEESFWKANLPSSQTNSEHTTKLNELTWSRLERVDPEFTSIAQVMALQYGYPIQVGNLTGPILRTLCPDGRTCSLEHLPEIKCGFDEEQGMRFDCALPASVWVPA